MVACPAIDKNPSRDTVPSGAIQRVQPEGWTGQYPAWWCEHDGITMVGKSACTYVHWERGRGRGAGAGTLLLASWRAWCRLSESRGGGEVIAVSLETE